MNTPVAVIITLLALLYTALFIHVATRHIERFTMSSQQNTIDTIVAQLHKAHSELVNRLEAAEANISAQLVDAGVPEGTIDLSALAGIAQALDDLTPDAAEDVEAVAEVVEEIEETELEDTEEAVEDTVEEVLKGEEAVNEAVEESDDDETK